jgi:uncharacterized protein
MPKHPISWDIIKQSIHFYVENAKYIINNTKRDLVLGFYGGEPLLESKLIVKSIKYLETNYKNIFKRFRFALTTNGTELNEEIIKFFIKYDFQLLVSLDGPSQVHDRYRVYKNGKGTFKDVQNNLNLIKKIDKKYFFKKVGFSTTIAPEYKLNEIVDFFNSFNEGKNRVNIFSNVEFEGTNFINNFDMEEVGEKFGEQRVKLKNEYMSKKILGVKDPLLENLFGNTISDIHLRIPQLFPKENYPNGICTPGIQKLFIDTNGNFQVCEKIDWSWDIGNIYEGFNVPKIYDLIQNYITKVSDHCDDCWAVRLCKECYLGLINVDKFSEEKREESCEQRKSNLLVGLKDYVSITDKNPNAFEEKGYEESIMFQAFKFLGRI